MRSAAPGPSRLRLRLFGLALLVLGAALILIAITADRDRGALNTLAVALVAILGAGFIVRSILIANHVLRAPMAEDTVVRRTDVDDERAAFVAVVSHELRNPMATIRGFAQMLRDQPELLQEEERQHAYDVIVRQVDRMAALLDNVLDASRIEAGALEYAFIPYGVRELLADAIEDAGALYPEHPITLDAGTAPARATGDRDRMKLVLANLLSNACRYSDPGTEVTVRAHAEGEDLVVDVIDRGIGIDAAEQSRLHERTAGGRTAAVDGQRGIGLGLFICRRVVEAHGGSVAVASTVGRGSTFTITVPLEPPPR